MSEEKGEGNEAVGRGPRTRRFSDNASLFTIKGETDSVVPWPSCAGFP